MIGSIIFGILTVVSIGVDWYWSSELNDSASQLENLLNAIQYGMSFDDFLNECWLFIILGFAFFCLCLAIAFPKHKKAV